MKRIYLLLIVILMILPLGSNMAFREGEKLVFTVKYGLVHAAEATLEVKSAKHAGRDVWHLTTNARTYPFFDSLFKVRDKVESWWDKETLLPHRFVKNLQEGSYRQHRIHTFDHAKGSTTYQRWSFKNSKFATEELKLLSQSQDVLSAFYYVRNQDLVPGRKVNLNITSDGRSMNTDVLVHKREKVNTIFGRIDCLVIEPKLKSGAVFKQSGRIQIWVTDDAYKIPVKMESAVTFGSFVAVLKEAANVPYKVK